MEKKQRARYFPVSATDWMKTKYGALDKDNPEVVFIQARTRVKSDHTKQSYWKEVRTINNSFLRSVSLSINQLKDYFAEEHLALFELSDIGLASNKTSVLKYEIFLKPKEKKKLSEYITEITALTSSVNAAVKTSLDLCHIMLANK